MSDLFDNTKQVVSIASFSIDHVAGSESDYILFDGKAFEAGNYPDKNFSLTAEEAQTAVAAFDAPVSMNYEHKPGFLDGCLGELRSVKAVGNQIRGVFAVPKWLKAECAKKNMPLKVSLEWDRKTKRIVGGAWALKPRIHDAEVFAAFSDSRKVGNSPGRNSMPNKLRAALVAQGVEINDELKALFASERESEIAKEAEEFASKLISDEKIVPGEKAGVISLFSQALRDDDESEDVVSFTIGTEVKTGTRAEMLTQAFAKRPKHTLTKEILTDNNKAAFALGNGTAEPTEEEKTRLAAAKLLTQTQTGRAALEEKK